MINGSRPILLISDTQIPFENKKALQFVKDLKKEFKIPDENCVHVGDEIDEFHASDYPKDPEMMVSPIQEIELARYRLQEWIKVFPKMKVAISNHGLRWIKKATNAGIPSELLRSYHEIFKLPESWEYRHEWRFMSLKHPFRVIHGMGYSGKDGHIQATLDAGISTAIGHLHSYAGINRISRLGGDKNLWGFNTGCLIDVDAVAFRYGRLNRAQPSLGAGVVIDSGRTPLWFPL